MKVVIDTNVYLSHFRFGGLPSRVCLFCLEEADVFISDFIITEVESILSKKFGLTAPYLELVKQTFLESTERVVPTNPLPDLCRDSDDNNILQLAQFVKADYLITGDKDLLVLETFDACRILTPKTFAESVGII